MYTPTLTGLGERSHLLSADIDLDMHIHDVVALLHFEDLHDVILVGHSYGGMVITGVADRAPTGSAASCTSTPRPRSTASRSSTSPDRSSKRCARSARSSTVSSWCCCPRPTPACFYGVTDAADLAWMADRLTGHPWQCFEQPLRLTNEEALWAIPQYHIVCTSTLPTRDRDLMARRAPPVASGRSTPATT